MFFFASRRIFRRFFPYSIEERCSLQDDDFLDRFHLLSSLRQRRKRDPRRSHEGDENLTRVLAREFSISHSANPFHLELGNNSIPLERIHPSRPFIPRFSYPRFAPLYLSLPPFFFLPAKKKENYYRQRNECETGREEVFLLFNEYSKEISREGGGSLK